jgi:hypothetical protein
VSPPRPGVSRLGRALDLLALVLVLVGAGAYIVSYLGLDKLRAADIAYSRGMPIQQLAEYDRLTLISWWGLAAIIAGVACGVFSWHRERKRSAREGTHGAMRE